MVVPYQVNLCFCNAVVTVLVCFCVFVNVCITCSAVVPLKVMIVMSGVGCCHKSTFSPSPFLDLETGHAKLNRYIPTLNHTHATQFIIQLILRFFNFH